MIDRQVLEKARDLIADENHWCQDEFATNAEGYEVDLDDITAAAWCADGALLHALGLSSSLLEIDPEYPDYKRAAAFLEAATRELYPEVRPDNALYIMVNDTLGHAAILKVYDRAIALAGGEKS